MVPGLNAAGCVTTEQNIRRHKNSVLLNESVLNDSEGHKHNDMCVISHRGTASSVFAEFAK